MGERHRDTEAETGAEKGPHSDTETLRERETEEREGREGEGRCVCICAKYTRAYR